MRPDQRRALLGLIDCCADIREVYACLALRKEKGSLDEIEELAQEEDTQALLSLEDDLLDYYQSSLALDVPNDMLERALTVILPAERRRQIQKRLNALPV